MGDLRIGVIGTGNNGMGHVAALLKTEGVNLVALCDIDDAHLNRAMERVGGPVATYKDYKEMISEVNLDGVVISTPHTLHYEQVMTCLDQGLHVLIEKPMACTSAHCRDIVRKQSEVNKVVLIGYQRHYEPRFRWVRDQIRNGVIGKVTYVQCFQGQNWLRNTAGTWRQDPAQSGGGQLNDSGSHLVDIILWLTDLEAEEVVAYMDNRGSQVDINSALAVKFRSGAVGSISVLGDQVARGMWEDISIAGENGLILLRQGGQVYMSTGPTEQPTLMEAANAGGQTDLQGAKDRNFVAAIRGQEENQVPAVYGVRVIELTEAAWRAAGQNGKALVEKG